MRTIHLRLQYIGTQYSGWQRQKNSTSIQQLLENAVLRITGEDAVVHGAGRTDAGVHAFDQHAMFRTSSNLTIERFATALNSQLPPDIRIFSALEENPTWHPRFTKHLKTYRYIIDTDTIVSPFWRPYVWQLPLKPNLLLLNQLAEHIIGEHDFRAFCSSNSSVKNHNRVIEQSVWTQEGTRLIYMVKGNGFLYHMVRLLVGSYVEVLLNKKSEQEFLLLLNQPDQNKATLTAPSQGLCLYKIVYEDSSISLDNSYKDV